MKEGGGVGSEQKRIRISERGPREPKEPEEGVIRWPGPNSVPDLCEVGKEHFWLRKINFPIPIILLPLNYTGWT